VVFPWLLQGFESLVPPVALFPPAFLIHLPKNEPEPYQWSI
jgi:hypothetical protein